MVLLLRKYKAPQFSYLLSYGVQIYIRRNNCTVIYKQTNPTQLYTDSLPLHHWQPSASKGYGNVL